jgi:ABC-type antimicrobial peptide transport system permease subunit
MKIASIGLVVGVSMALALSQVIQGILYGVSAADPIALLAAVLVFSIAAGLACLLPAWRATRIDPMRTLRE